MEAAPADTPSQGPHNYSADFVLTAPNTQGKQEVVERIYLASPSQVLAADPTSVPPASSWDVPGLHTAGQDIGHANGWQDRVADVPQHATVPAVDGTTDSLRDSHTATDASADAARGTGLLGVGCLDSHSEDADVRGVQTPAGAPLIPAGLKEGNRLGTAEHWKTLRGLVQLVYHIACPNVKLHDLHLI